MPALDLAQPNDSEKGTEFTLNGGYILIFLSIMS